MRKPVVSQVIVVERDGVLLQIIDALRASGRLASGLHGRQKQRNQNADDRNDDQQLNKSKGAELTPLRDNTRFASFGPECHAGIKLLREDDTRTIRWSEVYDLSAGCKIFSRSP